MKIADFSKVEHLVGLYKGFTEKVKQIKGAQKNESWPSDFLGLDFRFSNVEVLDLLEPRIKQIARELKELGVEVE